MTTFLLPYISLLLITNPSRSSTPQTPPHTYSEMTTNGSTIPSLDNQQIHHHHHTHCGTCCKESTASGAWGVASSVGNFAWQAAKTAMFWGAVAGVEGVVGSVAGGTAGATYAHGKDLFESILDADDPATGRREWETKLESNMTKLAEYGNGNVLKGVQDLWTASQEAPMTSLSSWGANSLW